MHFGVVQYAYRVKTVPGTLEQSQMYQKTRDDH